jgi:succinyl-CoA synthetase beta subunit
MLLLEHDAKTLLQSRGVSVPQGVLISAGQSIEPGFSGPWVVKAQVPVGGRGKAGGIRIAATAEALLAAIDSIGRLAIRGHQVAELRVEAAVQGGSEAYVGLSVDPGCGQIAVMVSAAGGVDVEDHAEGAMHSAYADPDPTALMAAFNEIIPLLPEGLRAPVREIAELLAPAFVELDATLLEINPLFVLADGGWVAGDVRLVVDENALPRQPEINALLDARPQAYPDATFKRGQGFDLVVVDPMGEIGLVTTGAGLSMKLIDEMVALGARPYNFCDIRSGMMRGDPARLIEAFRIMGAGPNLRCVLVNIFAGITDLGEFAGLLVSALKALPEMRLPIVVRLVGNGEERAEALLRASGLDLVIENDLDKAVAKASALVRGEA